MLMPRRKVSGLSVQTMSFVWPHFSELVKARECAIARKYPALGEYAKAV